MTQFPIVVPARELLMAASVAILPTKVQLRIVAGLIFLMPPPRSARFLLNVQLVTAGLLSELFHIPPDEMKNVGRLFDEAKKDANDFEPYAEQISMMFAHQPAVMEELLGGLFQIARADGFVHPKELEFLRKTALIFGFSEVQFERLKTIHMGDMGGADGAAPYQVLGLSSKASDDQIKKTYRTLIRENHPDTLIAQGMPQEFIDVANEKMAAINAAYDVIEKERGLK